MSAILVTRVAGVAMVQDAGRPGHMHEGVPPGGALVPELLARANVAARNVPGAAAIESFGTLVLEAREDAFVAFDDGTARPLSAGTSLTIACEGARVRYVAVRGGLDVPELLGGRGTLLVASLGGHEGRPLRRGDLLRAGDAPRVDASMPSAPDLASPIRVVPGPDRRRFPDEALDLLLSSSFVVDARSDRVGVRLTGGPALPRLGSDSGPSSPMVRGAIQVPPSGMAVVLGPDHPTTGGYPVLATVITKDFGSLAARSPGARVRFVTQP
ncbi:MAG TPA: biotin-dependent carboxyltransferase family protein [Polyangiaceae bacterium]|nr:biotin-dependent carboxyltransferase family protein [Polyangiaceae bacterium]